MSRAQVTMMMQFVVLLIAIVFVLAYLSWKPLDVPVESGARTEVIGANQVCSQSSTECMTVRLGEFGGGISKPTDSIEEISGLTTPYLRAVFSTCAKNGMQDALVSFNAEDTTAVLSAPIVYAAGNEQGVVEKFTAVVPARYAVVRGLEEFSRAAEGRREVHDFNLDVLTQVDGSAAVYENS